MPVPIPDWNCDGFISPINSEDPTSPSRSPYEVNLTDVVLRFATSGIRRRILRGLLEYRQRLHAVGVCEGFQWLDGSFMEHVEDFKGKSPADIDVVSFFKLADGIKQADLVSQDPEILDNTAVKATFCVDAYLVDLALPPPLLVASSIYWYSMWSHRRTMEWKGFLTIDLSPDLDLQAMQLLKASETEGGDQ